jgi:pimeloyl-ACP methyl ester carboxylesterase
VSLPVDPQSSLVRPCSIHISEATLRDLRRRLGATRWTDEIPSSNWDYGTNLGYLKNLVAYWRNAFDWRAEERRLNELSHFCTDISGLEIHFIHARGNGPKPFPLVLTHGWPSSFYELTKLVPLLTDPAAYGGDPADAFDVVVPSMPGFGFSGRPTERFLSTRVDDLWAQLMRRLGYRRFGAHGGDIGGGVSARLGQFHPEVVAGIHVTNVYGAIGENDSPPTEAERRHLEQQRKWERDEGAYGDIQSTRPQTLAYGLNDSPAGLAAWIVEKYRAWSDCGGDVERVFSKDELLTNITIYWATQTIGSSFRPYWDSRNNANPRPWVRISVPCGIAVFPFDIERPPREFAERSYNVKSWTEMPRGGHFAALEEPQLLAQDIRSFFRELRAGDTGW